MSDYIRSSAVTDLLIHKLVFDFLIKIGITEFCGDPFNQNLKRYGFICPSNHINAINHC